MLLHDIREMERQRQLEWERQKSQELQAQRQKEQDILLKLKAKNQTLTIELGTLVNIIEGHILQTIIISMINPYIIFPYLLER